MPPICAPASYVIAQMSTNLSIRMIFMCNAFFRSDDVAIRPSLQRSEK